MKTFAQNPSSGSGRVLLALSVIKVHAIKDLDRNFASSSEFDENSFISNLHEAHVWDDREYWKLDSAIYSLASELGESEDVPRAIAWPVAKIFSDLMMMFEAHHDQKDGFEIRDLDCEEIFNRRERVQLVFEGFFKGVMIPNDSFDYSNPKPT